MCFFATVAFALDPQKAITQFVHTAWTEKDGAPADLFRMRVRDDGKGMDPHVLEAGGRAGHGGLAGLRERAQKLGVRLDFWSETGAGTEVQLTVPAAVAYDQSYDRVRFRLFRKARIHEHQS